MTETVSFSDAYTPEDVIAGRVDEDRELELTIAYANDYAVRTVFLSGETLRAFAKFVAEADAEINGAEETTEDTETEAEAEADHDPNRFYAERADAWHAARGLLVNNGMAIDATPEAVLELARFLAGDDL
ncbi:hypothetical protein CPT_Shaeky_039 [Streptomyces phage Shaeky]|uniref:Uncharacterized protein n=1 Tax=Streptomyces phage Shaeky TaxID=2767586 RepID=A0A873WJQ0_9CAUD|nr:hypothetical protein CPT_Shaeky_039 [Streptomyces phage Shaeky]